MSVSFLKSDDEPMGFVQRPRHDEQGHSIPLQSLCHRCSAESGHVWRIGCKFAPLTTNITLTSTKELDDLPLTSTNIDPLTSLWVLKGTPLSQHAVAGVERSHQSAMGREATDWPRERCLALHELPQGARSGVW